LLLLAPGLASPKIIFITRHRSAGWALRCPPPWRAFRQNCCRN